MLERLTLRRLRLMEHSQGVAWTADLYLDGKLLCHVHNEGNGGCTNFAVASPCPASPGLRQNQLQDVLKPFELACQQALKVDREGLSLALSGAEDGQTVARGVHAALAHGYWTPQS